MDELCFELKSKGIDAPRFTYVTNQEEYILSQYETSPPQEQRIVCHIPTLQDMRLYHKEVQLFMWKKFTPLNPFMFNLIRLGNYQLMPPIKELTEKQAKEAVSTLVFKNRPPYKFFKAAPPSPSTLFHALETIRMSSLPDIYAHHVSSIKDHVRRDKEAKRIWDGVNALIDQVNAIPVVTIDSDMDLVEIVVLVCMYRALNIEPLYVKVHSRITKVASPKIIRNAEKRLRRIMLGPSEYKSKHKSVNLKAANKAAVEKAVQYLESASQSVSAIMSIDEFSGPDEISGFRWSRNVLSGISLPFKGKPSDRNLINRLKFGSKTQPLEMNITGFGGAGKADKYYSQDLKKALVRAIESQFTRSESKSVSYIMAIRRNGWQKVYEDLKAVTDTAKLQRLLDDDVTPWLKQRVFMRADLPLLGDYEILQSMIWKIIRDRNTGLATELQAAEETSEEREFRTRIYWFIANKQIYDLLIDILTESRLRIKSFINDTIVAIYDKIYKKVLTTSTSLEYEYYRRLLILLFDLTSYRLQPSFLKATRFDINDLKRYFTPFPIMIEAILQYERKNNIKSNWELLGYIKNELYFQ